VAWGATLLIQGTDVNGFLLYLPHPIPLPEIAFPTGIRVSIGNRRIPVRAIFGGGDIGRIGGAGLELKSQRHQVWAMYFKPFYALQTQLRPAAAAWSAPPASPFAFRVLRAP
jgi:hypothetical protein